MGLIKPIECRYHSLLQGYLCESLLKIPLKGSVLRLDGGGERRFIDR